MSGAARIEVRLQPGAPRDEIVGERAGRIVVRVGAPPVEGRANDALRKLVAKRARVASGAVSIVRGARSRDKTLAVEGIDDETLRSRLLG